MNERKERHGCVSAWLWLTVILNLIYAIYYAVMMFDAYTSSMSLGLGLLSILAAFNILGSILLMRWNKRGFYIFLVASILAAIVNLGVLEMGLSFVSSGVLGIFLWWGILQIRKNGVSAWKLMENSWDYKHCRHLYQFFGVIIGILLVLTIVAFSGNHAGNPYERILSSADDILVEDSVVVDDEIVWHTFSDVNNTCSIEAPNDFRSAKLSDDQILGLICTDYDPAVVIISETVNSLKASEINTTKEYADVVVKMNKNVDGASGFNKVSENTYGDGSYLIVYNLSIGDTNIRYNLLTSKTKSNFYYCKVYCLEEYAVKLQPIISHMLSSFKVTDGM